MSLSFAVLLITAIIIVGTLLVQSINRDNDKHAEKCRLAEEAKEAALKAELAAEMAKPFSTIRVETFDDYFYTTKFPPRRVSGFLGHDSIQSSRARAEACMRASFERGYFLVASGDHIPVRNVKSTSFKE